MRVISGEKKGIRLKAVNGMQTRPTTDKVKESIFNMIGPYFDGGAGLDLFAGSGGLGIEAISRGLDKVTFIDRDNQAIQTIHKNLETCQFQNQSEVFRTDADRALKALKKREITFDLVFMDPPYKKQQLEKLMSMLLSYELLRKEAAIVCEHDTTVMLPETIDSLVCEKKVNYGLTTVTIYRFNG